MATTVLLVVPTRQGVGQTAASLGLVRALDRLGVRVGFSKPISQLDRGEAGPDRTSALIALCSAITPTKSVSRSRAEALLALGQEQQLLEEVVGVCSKQGDECDVLVVEGLGPGLEVAYYNRLNRAMARALDAEVVLVGRAGDSSPQELAESLAITARQYEEDDGDSRVSGCLINRMPEESQPYLDAVATLGIPLAGVFPVLTELSWPRVSDLVRQLRPEILYEGNQERRIECVRVLARSVPGVLETLQPGSLLITPGDRHDIIMAACLAAQNGRRFAGLLLSVSDLDPAVKEITASVKNTGLPVMSMAPLGTFETTTAVNQIHTDVAPDDSERGERMMNAFADLLDEEWVERLTKSARAHRISPPAFRYRVLEKARQLSKRIVLPEAEENRTLRAAVQCQERGIARCVLLGDPETVRARVEAIGLQWPDGLEVWDPNLMRERYLQPLMELRKDKGLSEKRAREGLQDRITLGTMMLKMGDVDGLVAGAEHTTAATIRPALQLVKTAEDCSLVSSIFFMCLPDQVVVYGDCAVNPDPSVEELADIAIQSAESARAFGIEPQVAMISYATGESGAGHDVDKVRRATRLVRELRPDLPVEGPIQYDAAAISSVARSKIPGSKVAGHATVFVFPDLNTGNTVYKAVQRTAHVVSMGPMLQGLARPVNDLSRGALVEDIVYTIALTAIQADQAMTE